MGSKRTLVSFDWALKYIFRDEQNLGILENFLQILLNREIKLMGFADPEENIDSDDSKSNRVDLKAKDTDGNIVLIELQHHKEYDYLERIYYAACKSSINTMKKGYKYGQVTKIISVSIVYFDIAETNYAVKGVTRFEDLISGESILFTNKESQKGIEKFAEYYIIQPNKFDGEIKEKIDEWVYFFKNSDVLESFKYMDVEGVQEKLDIAKMSPEELNAFQEYNTNEEINKGIVEVAMEDGKVEGKLQGIIEGKIEGKHEQAIETAKILLKNGIDIKIIASSTGLTESEVANLK